MIHNQVRAVMISVCIIGCSSYQPGGRKGAGGG